MPVSISAEASPTKPPKHLADAIYIISKTPARASEIKNSLDLRGFDQVKCYPMEKAGAIVGMHPPDLLLLDAEGDNDAALALITSLGGHCPIIYLAESFDEDLFLTCYDAGAKDFLVKPVTSAYLVSRVLLILDERRLREQMHVRDIILKELSVIGPDSNVYTTEYIVKLLKREVEILSMNRHNELCLLVVQLEGFDTGLAVNPTFKKMLYQHVAKTIGKCSRGADIVGEYFEDKFAIILPNTGLDGGQSVANRIIHRLDGASLVFEKQDVPLSIFIGVADFTGCIHYEDLLNKAMERLKMAKTTGDKIAHG